jgi:hypothetical protein
MNFNFLQKQTSRREMLRDSATLAGSAFLAHLFPATLLRVIHQAAEAEGCDFPGLGPHPFRRANITLRQQVRGSALEASKIAGHSDLEMTGEYTFVEPERQNRLSLVQSAQSLRALRVRH